MNWAIFNKGEFETTSKDWTVTSKKRLFQNVFESSKHSNCDFVIVMVGLQDYIKGDKSITPENTFENIKNIVEALERLEKKVVLCYIPNPDSWDLKKTKKLENCFAHTVNNKIKSEFENSNSVILGPLCDLSNYKYFRSDLYQRTRPYFDQKGHRFFAADLFDILVPTISKYEINLIISPNKPESE
ncbi:hypothetical protein BB560_003629 [Smittium megazygosporum]|uniref:SGNH hydrolase-type esterase domain-containing protein n=1 Tax=Smittium megazygosporum TaxID=133381 RepID=A0A2T9ZBG2_9FUNG|nr:hypothetical protein BB560_003629 [Smittium megazygosporum]